jgi:DUF4097 and DUF4098 domain-containing protein YvlB
MNIKGAIAVAVLCLIPLAASASSESLYREHVFEVRPGMSVTVDVSSLAVEVTARPGSTVEVTVDIEISGSAKKVQRALKALEPVFREEAGGVVIRSKKKGFSAFGSANVRGRVTVVMPPDLDLMIDSSSGSSQVTGDFGTGNIVCDTSSGSFRMTGAARSVVADLSSGSVVVDLTRPADSVRADTSSGKVTLKGGAAEFQADTSSGSITADGLEGDATMDASSGSITASWTAIPSSANIRADASSGSVRLTLPAAASLSGTVNTSSGGIQSDFPGRLSDDGDRMEFDGGPDAVRVKIDTSSGSVHLRSF